MSARETDNRTQPPPAVLDAFGLQPASVEACEAGLINQTWRAESTSGDAHILQRVNPLFPPSVHGDIEAVTRHLHAKGLTTPLLVPTRSGAPYLEHDGEIWRAQTCIEGICLHALESETQAREAGRVLGEFHRALDDLEHEFTAARLGVHDTPRHLAALEAALEDCRGHARHAAVRDLAEEIASLAAALPGLPPGADRVVHGDPKISNLVFASDCATGICLIDLDTLGRMPAALELGDAFRSWCNPAREEAPDARLSPALFGAAVAGYADAVGSLLEPAEREAIPDATATIAVELAARFCADALRERYFGWDARRYASASHHNEARARGQLRLALSILEQRGALRASVEQAFARAVTDA